ncbi:MAG: hypothetical protein HY327_12500 [Chloroflexi bacterium]|nr:hypothetical protein [Chloroflexota bacterium]
MGLSPSAAEVAIVAAPAVVVVEAAVAPDFGQAVAGVAPAVPEDSVVALKMEH